MVKSKHPMDIDVGSTNYTRFCKLRRVILTLACLAFVAATVLCCSYFLSNTIQSHGMAVAPDNQSPTGKILVFGGNGFLGAETVTKLLGAGYQVVVVNRGNWYWDSYFRVKPFVTHVQCDRMKPLDEKCTELVDIVGNSSFDAVIDFSAYIPFSAKQALKLVKNKAKLYIYISTDSVYEVCEKTHNQTTRETDAVRPQSLERRHELESVESYGHNKLLIEEELAAQREVGGIPYISLRLPDVIGPRDTTYRWWIYQMWLKLADHLDKPPSIPEYLVSTPMSLVYVNDVADVIVKLLTPKPEALDQAFNLAFTETPTLLQLLTDLKMALNLTDLPLMTDDSSSSIHMFPSVRNGPIDISKAQDILDWSPTPLNKAILETVDFYEKAVRDPYLNNPRKDVIRSLQTHFTNRPFKVLLGLKKHYGLDFQVPKDEL
ncbi:hypothetical protein BaRGS_00010107 [Batillaria attramentaria]|uniref:NAD-dependent epimerase/dehydratase domain-containing protein n=1 Tax=Batillaria attramentaria TaxID=370345 RepID=A0ABD0LH63_9CAEN